MEKWKVTEQHQTLQATFASTPGLSKARKVIGLALGGLVHGPEVSERSFLQYALLLSLREFISKGGRSNSSESADEVACFAQDPMLFPTAVEALGSAGITVLDDPEAFLEIDDTTLVLSIAPNVPVKQIVTEIARPAAIVWCKGSLLRDGESPMQV
jgi:hypothetical protein